MRILYIAPQEMAVSVSRLQTVGLFLGKPPESLGFDPDIGFGLELSPDEARRLARLLKDKADEAEAGSSLN